VAAAENVAAALALGLDQTAHAIAGGDVVQRTFWINRLSRASQMLAARAAADRKAK
jgi:hypothetical protein